MAIRLKYIGIRGRNRQSGMSLVEIVIALAIVVMTLSGVFYAYVQTSRMSEWSAMSLAAQSYANQGIERARAADWYYQTPYQTGAGTGDELAPTNNSSPIFTEIDTNFIPQTGTALLVTNYIYITSNRPATSPTATGPFVRQIRSDAVWTFPYTKTIYTNTAVTLRARDK